MKIFHNNSEEKLIKKCLNNNRQAQFELYEKYKDAMYTLAFRIIGNHDDAKDALQEGFINVFLNLSSYKGEASLGAWIKTIIIRLSIKKNKTKIHFEEIDNIELNDTFEFDSNLSGEAIEKAILELDKGYRTVFILSEVEGYKHKEIAEILDISEGTSKSQLYHAKKHLRTKLQFA